MSRQVAEDATPIESVEQLCRYILEGAKPPERHGHGLEYERLGVFLESGETVPFAGNPSVQSVLRALAEEHGWAPLLQEGQLVELQRGSAAVSLEPGAQLEFAGSVHRDLESLRDELCGFLDDVNRVSQPLGIGWLALGLNPFTPVERIGWIPKSRYRIMSSRLGKRGRLAHYMMKATAGIQGNFDFESETDAMEKLRLAMGVTSISTAIMANSPLYLGRPNDFQSMRAFIWLDTDPDRCGLLKFAFHRSAGIQSYVDYALSVPVLFIVRDGRWIDMEGYTFRRFLSEGREEWRATFADWALHLTTLFPEVRLKRYLEVRGTDSVDSELTVAAMAWWKGLLYSAEARRAAWKLVERFTWHQRQQLHRDICSHGLEAEVDGTPVRELARQLTAVARTGLSQMHASGDWQDETAFLDPLEQIIEDPEAAPARQILLRWEKEWDGDRSRLVEYCSRTTLRCSS